MRKTLWFLVIPICASWAAASTNTWQVLADPNNPVTPAWSVAGNWSDGVPDPNDDVVFPAGSSTFVDLDVAATVHSLRLEVGNFDLVTSCTPDPCVLTLAAGITNILGGNTLGVPIVLAADQTIDTPGGPLILGGAVGGPGKLTKTGSETLQLLGSGSNTYSGGTVVLKGQVDLGKLSGGIAIPGPLTIGDGTASAKVLVTPNGTAQIAANAAVTIVERGVFDLNGEDQTVGSLNMTGGRIQMTRESVVATLTLGGDVTATSGSTDPNTADPNSATPTIDGKLSLGGATRTFDVADGPDPNDLLIVGPISGSAGLIKTGTGVMRMEGAASNTYTGDTNVEAGTLQLSKNSSLLSIPGTLHVGDGTGGDDADQVVLTSGGQISDTASVTIQSSGLLQLNNVNDSFNSLTVSGGHAKTTGVSGALSVDALTISADPEPALIEGTLKLDSTLTITVADGAQDVDLDLAATLTGVGGLIKAGPGRLQLSGASNYGGLTTVNAGTLRVTSALGLGAGGTGTTVTANGALELGPGLTFTGEALTLNGSSALTLLSGQTTLSQPVTLASASTISVPSGASLILNAALGGPGGLTKTGDGTLDLIGRSYTGPTLIEAGTLLARSVAPSSMGGTMVSSGAALELGTNAVVNETLTLAGPGAGGGGALRSNGNNQWLGPVVLVADATVNVLPSDPNAALVLSGLSGVVSGSGGLTKMGSGTLQLAGSLSNTYAGTTRVEEGRLELNKTNGGDPNNVAVPGNLIVGGGSGAALVLLPQFRREQIADTAIVTLNPSGTLDLTNLSAPNVETICRLINNGGTLLNPSRLVETRQCAGPVPQTTETGRTLLVLGLMLGAGLALRRAGERRATE
jgi:fibronectin-binding autotransporter adhesin